MWHHFDEWYEDGNGRLVFRRNTVSPGSIENLVLFFLVRERARKLRESGAEGAIICVQESHWKDTVAPTFVTANWQAYCSPTTDSKSAGLVTLIDKSLLSQCQVLFADPHPGRVQHIRVVHSAWSVDLLNIYQKTYNSHPKASSDSKAVRAAVWQCIHDQIGPGY
ncbi:hypothetical protein AK812_SmicGene10911 [Symbiodinium microadriaticum]|uniref:Endonuclease/exonuclease/phosphatase domain-containing protein n=1 Tax=Symbiodinium microadriaticum TaxID=2951 RepID=A0A1Q9EEQ6_SYMMI|nr:hypothetical protein AK812_SmicGene10911 [Symbiodinium microadriaticum]